MAPPEVVLAAGRPRLRYDCDCECRRGEIESDGDVRDAWKCERLSAATVSSLIGHGELVERLVSLRHWRATAAITFRSRCNPCLSVLIAALTARTSCRPTGNMLAVDVVVVVQPTLVVVCGTKRTSLRERHILPETTRRFSRSASTSKFTLGGHSPCFSLMKCTVG